MTTLELLQLLKNVRADYAATCRDLHGLKRLLKQFNKEDFPLIAQMDKAILHLKIDSEKEHQ